MGDVEGQKADVEATVAAQRLVELTQGQEAALEIFVGQTGAKRVTQSLESDAVPRE